MGSSAERVRGGARVQDCRRRSPRTAGTEAERWRPSAGDRAEPSRAMETTMETQRRGEGPHVEGAGGWAWGQRSRGCAAAERPRTTMWAARRSPLSRATQAALDARQSRGAVATAGALACVVCVSAWRCVRPALPTRVFLLAAVLLMALWNPLGTFLPHNGGGFRRFFLCFRLPMVKKQNNRAVRKLARDPETHGEDRCGRHQIRRANAAAAQGRRTS